MARLCHRRKIAYSPGGSATEIAQAEELGVETRFKAGITAAGIGSNFVKKEWVAAGDYAAITAKTAEVLAWIREVKGR